jgi:hypothetical protein
LIVRVGPLLCAAVFGALLGCAAPIVPPANATQAATKLSFRLALLVQSPQLRGATADVQARALSLPPLGPGSLMRDSQGRLLVNIRTTDVTAAGLQALRDAGADVTNVSERDRVVTAFVPIAELEAVANVASVQSVREELAPAMGGRAVFPTPP